MDPKPPTAKLPWTLAAVFATACVFLFATRDRTDTPSPSGASNGKPTPTATPSKLADNTKPVRDPDAADFEQLLNEPPGDSRREKVIAAVRAMAANDPVAALARVEAELEGTERAAAIRAGLEVWAQTDPDAAGEWVLEMGGDPAFESTLVGFVGDWTKFDPRAASAWVSKLPPNEANESAADALAAEWSKTDALAAYDWALDHYAKTQTGIAFQRAIAALAQGHPATAIEALDRAHPDLQYRGHSQIASAWAHTDHAAAADWAAGLPNNRNKGAALSNVLDAWSQTAPSEAAEFLVGLGEFPGQATAAATLVGNWAMSDSVRASEWLSTLPGGTLRDEAITGFTYALGFTDPTSALAWGLDIGQPELRDARVEEMLADWHDREPLAARAWMEANPQLPEPIKSRVLEL